MSRRPVTDAELHEVLSGLDDVWRMAYEIEANIAPRRLRVVLDAACRRGLATRRPACVSPTNRAMWAILDPGDEFIGRT